MNRESGIMNEFTQMMKQLIWYVIILGIFIFYMTYQQSLDRLTVMVLSAIALITALGGGSWSTLKYWRAKKQSDRAEEENEAQCVVWSALDELQYDLMGWFVFILIIGTGFVSSSKLNVADFGQAIIAFAAFIFGKRFFVKKV